MLLTGEWLLVVFRAPPRPSPGSILYDGTDVELHEMMPSLHDEEDSGNASDHALQVNCYFLLSYVTTVLSTVCRCNVGGVIYKKGIWPVGNVFQ